MATFKTKYITPITISFSTFLAGLASDTNRLIGAQSDVINLGDTANLFLDAYITGKITTGTTVTVDRLIDIWMFWAHNETPTFPDTFGASAAGRTITSANVRNAMLIPGRNITVDATNNRTYWVFIPVKDSFRVMPRRLGLFIAHDTVAALNATDTNHEFLLHGTQIESA